MRGPERDRRGEAGLGRTMYLKTSGQKGAVFSGRRRLLSEAGTRTTCKQVGRSTSSAYAIVHFGTVGRH